MPGWAQHDQGQRRGSALEAELILQALLAATASFWCGAIRPTGQLEEDLEQLAAGPLAFVDAHATLAAQVLPEIAHDPRFGGRSSPGSGPWLAGSSD